MRKRKILPPPATIGIIGGGQLGRMISVAAKRLGYNVIILDPTPFSPAGQVADRQITASFADKNAYQKLAAECDVLTYEFEHIDAGILVSLEMQGCNIYPSAKTLMQIQDKYIQKTILHNAGVPVPDFCKAGDKQDILQFIDRMGLPLVLKTRAGGYDGKGNCILKAKNEIEGVLEKLGGNDLLAEKFVLYERELSIIAARSLNNNLAFYPIVENVHEDNILRLTRAPANLDNHIENKVKNIASAVMDVFDDYGVFCIEMFLTADGSIYINEIAPRPHNSGHYTIEACDTSQFEQLVRAITGMPLGPVKLRSSCVMVNILGNETVDGPYRFEGVEEILGEEGVFLHVYGKSYSTKRKKIGHITVLDNSIQVAEAKAIKAINTLALKPL
ncbi:MAG: 5-(carboxyamino)imidazole ribonucleotide synthase [Firmicutes bacterium]|nr:5-(carboxyamino)imidazole ribonucleotide synthase [Bacillota bacterium]